MLTQRVKIKALSPKADGTCNITGQSLLEIDKHTFQYVNDLAFDKEEVMMIIIRPEEYIDFIIDEAKRLANKME